MTLSFNEQVNSVGKSANFHLRVSCHNRNYISEDTTKTIACSMIGGQMDYCKALLYGTSAANIHILQQLQNSMDHAVTHLRP